MDLTQTSKCDEELWGHSKVVMLQPLDITDLHISPFWNLLPLPLRAARLHTPWTQDRTFVPPDSSVDHSSGLILGLPPPPSRADQSSELSILLLTWSHLISDRSSLFNRQHIQAYQLVMLVWWKLTHPHLHFHIFIARWENYRIA